MVHGWHGGCHAALAASNEGLGLRVLGKHSSSLHLAFWLRHGTSQVTSVGYPTVSNSYQCKCDKCVVRYLPSSWILGSAKLPRTMAEYPAHIITEPVDTQVGPNVP